MSPEQARGKELDGAHAISSLSALCCTKWRRAPCHSEAKRRLLIFNAILERAPVPAMRGSIPNLPAEDRGHHQPGARERSRTALSERQRNAIRTSAAKARYRLQPTESPWQAESSRSFSRALPPAQTAAVRPLLQWQSSTESEIGVERAALQFCWLARRHTESTHSLSRARPAPFQTFAVSKVTETGKATLVAISPDGKYLLHVMDDGGQQSLWLRNIPTNSNTQVVAPGAGRISGPALFSRRELFVFRPVRGAAASL